MRPRRSLKRLNAPAEKAIAIQADAHWMPTPSKAAVEKTVATFGRLDVLVNNAGTAHSEEVRGDYAGGAGSRDRHQRPAGCSSLRRRR